MNIYTLMPNGNKNSPKTTDFKTFYNAVNLACNAKLMWS